MHRIEPKLKAVPEGDFICVYCRQANAFSKLARRSNLPKKQFIATANADEVLRSKRYIGKDISRNMAGFPEPLLGRIDSYHSDGAYKIVYHPTGAIERVGWEELYVILKQMEEEVQIKCIAEEDRKGNIDAALEALEVKKMQEKMAIAEESLKRRDSSDMDQGRELFTHVGRPIIIANTALAVVVDKKDGQIIVRGKDQNERSISVDELHAALDKVTGISSPLLFAARQPTRQKIEMPNQTIN